MAASLPTHDTKPWYKQFWLWFLISLPGAVVIAGLSTVYIAYLYSDDLVADEYYKNGLAINRQLEKLQRAEEIGLTAQLHFSQKNGVGLVKVTVNGLSGVEPLNLALSHPLEADKDFSVQLRAAETGVYTATLMRPIAARWHWTLESIGSTAWRLNGTVRSPDIYDESVD